MQSVHTCGKVLKHLGEQVIIVGCLLHVLRIALHVHEDIGNSQAGHCGEHVPVQFATRDVIDDLHPELLHAHACYIGAEGIHTHHSIGSHTSQDSQRMTKTLHLLLGRHVVGTRPARIGSYVNHIGSLGQHLPCAQLDVCLGLLTALCIKGVGGDIENTHHSRDAQIHKRSAHIYGIMGKLSRLVHATSVMTGKVIHYLRNVQANECKKNAHMRFPPRWLLLLDSNSFSPATSKTEKSRLERILQPAVLILSVTSCYYLTTFFCTSLLPSV